MGRSCEIGGEVHQWRETLFRCKMELKMEENEWSRLMIVTDYEEQRNK